MRIAVLLVLCASLAAVAQDPPAAPAVDYSGMYTFLHEGEFVQVNVEEGNVVTGFISRYDDEERHKDNFVDQFFKTAALDGNKLTFTTKKVHGVFYDFKGTVERGPAKTRADEGYFVLRGTLTENVEDAEGKVKASARQVEFKSFPADVDLPPRK